MRHAVGLEDNLAEGKTAVRGPAGPPFGKLGCVKASRRTAVTVPVSGATDWIE